LELRNALHWWKLQPNNLMQIRVLFFGVLKDIVGRPSETLELPEGARLQAVLSHYSGKSPHFQAMLPSLALSVNQEYSGPDKALLPGDEVGLLPPVSGGSEAGRPPAAVRIVREPISTQAELDQLKLAQDGAAVTFEGVVRNHTRGRRTLYLDYEAYEAMALKQMEALTEQARLQFAIRDVVLVHRLGRVEIGETSVLIVVASAHRGPAFEACRWIIDTLKKTVPIWKKEYFEDGVVWADGEPFPEEISRPTGTDGAQPASK
jgi:molybdopterin synthase catalytic subunit